MDSELGSNTMELHIRGKQVTYLQRTTVVGREGQRDGDYVGMITGNWSGAVEGKRGVIKTPMGWEMIIEFADDGRSARWVGHAPVFHRQ